MAELTGKLIPGSVSYAPRGQVRIWLELNEKSNALEMLNELESCEKLNIKITKYRPKRSNDANAYCWVLLGKLSEKLGIPPREIYQRIIRDVGGNFEVVCVQDKAVDKLRESWGRNGIGWVTEVLPSKIYGCTNVLLYYGSSTYDTAQMSRLINLIVDECKTLGIETRNQEELGSLLSQWEAK